MGRPGAHGPGPPASAHAPQPADRSQRTLQKRRGAGCRVPCHLSISSRLSRLSYHLSTSLSYLYCVACRVSHVCACCVASRVSRSTALPYNKRFTTVSILCTRPCITHQSGSDSASRSACGERLEGNSTSARTCSVPLRGGSAPRRGIPLPRTLMTCMGAVTSERSSFTRWPSRWTRAVSKPSSAAWSGSGLGVGLGLA